MKETVGPFPLSLKSQYCVHVGQRIKKVGNTCERKGRRGFELVLELVNGVIHTTSRVVFTINSCIHHRSKQLSTVH